MPSNMEDYIHRIGRTGRAEAVGVAHSFFVEEADKKNVAELVKIMENAKQEISEVCAELGWVSVSASVHGSFLLPLYPWCRPRRTQA